MRIRSLAPSRSESTSDSTQTVCSIALAKSNCGAVAPSGPYCSQVGGDCAWAGAAMPKDNAAAASAA